MGRRAVFNRAVFLEAAIRLIAENGAAGLSIAGLAEAVGAPTGSVYHRYRSRADLLGDVWLSIVEEFQAGFLARLEDDEGAHAREAALFTPKWAAENEEKAWILLLNRSKDLERDSWSQALRVREKTAAHDLMLAMARFTKAKFGARAALRDRAKVRFALIDMPSAAVRPYLEARESIPACVREFVILSFDSVFKQPGAAL